VNNNLNNFSKLIFTLRKEKGLTQAELGEKLNISDKAVSKWETGESYPETSQLITISKFFGITVDELLKGERKPNEEEISRERYLEQLRASRKPLTMKDIILLTIGTVIIVFAIGLAALLWALGVDYYLLPIPFCIGAAIGATICMFAGLNKFIAEGELEEGQIKKADLSRNLLCIGVFITILLLAPASMNFILWEANIAAIAVAASLLIIALPFLVLGGLLWNQEVLCKVPVKKIARLRKADKWHGIVWSTGIFLALIIFLPIGVVTGAWSPAWIVFPIAAFICIIISSIVEIKNL